MGCFESKNDKFKAKPCKIVKSLEGQFNQRWKRHLQTSIVRSYIVDNAHEVAKHPSYEAIKKDVYRTFPSHLFFSKPQNIELFKDLLQCFALTFPKVGYTQGLNFLAGYFLINKMDKQSALNILVQASTHPELMFLGLYEDGFPLVQLNCSLFWKILKKVDTQLYDCLKIIGITDHMWIFQWYLTFYLYSFPLQYIPFFFNYIFQYKYFAMVKISVGVVLCLRDDIINLNEKDDVAFCQYLEQLKDSQNCVKMLNLEDCIQKAHSISNRLIDQCLFQINKDHDTENFYLQYFSEPQNRRHALYKNWKKQIEEKTVELSNSKHDQKLMESYKRSRSTVQILDQILLESIKRQMNKKYKSNLLQTRKNKINRNNQFRKWRSLANLDQDVQKEDETTVSIVKKVIIPEQKDQ